jgi:multidrug resistance efflux pump
VVKKNLISLIRSSASARHLSLRWAPSDRSGFVVPLILAGLVVLLLLGGGTFVYLRSLGLNEPIKPILAEVTRGEFVSLVLDQGEVQSSENIEIRCEAKARNGVLTVLRAVPEGTMVKEGDFLVQLDATGYEKELEQQKVVLANAKTLMIQADTKLKTSVEALREYKEGTFVEAKKLIENEIFDAKSLIATSNQNLKQAEANLEHSKKLAAKGYITPQGLQSAEFAVNNADLQVKKAQNMLALGEKKMYVLENITSKKFILQFEADIEAADVALKSQTDAYEVEKAKIKEIESMTGKCLIKVPTGVSGQVTYAKESSRGGQDWVLEEGGTVRENQVLIRLPNPRKMEVKALINEQSITQIAPGMPVKIRVDALNNQELVGRVTKVNQYAEQSGWMSTSVRKYAVFVSIINPPESLKAGMNASVSIQTQYADNALIAPIQTVYGMQGKQFCLIKKGENQWETREVRTAAENAQHVLIAEGLKEGESLVMNPAAYKDYMDLPQIKLVNKIDVGDEGSPQTSVTTAVDSSQPSAGQASMVHGRTAGGPPEVGPSGDQGRGGIGMSNFPIPVSASALIKEKDKDADGKLSRDEAGSPFYFFFDRIDADSDSLLSESELDESLQKLRQLRTNRGGGATGVSAAVGGPAQ